MNFITERIRQIFFMKGVEKRVVSTVLALAVAVTTLFSHGTLIAKAATGNVNLSGFSATIGGVNLQEAGPLEDGQELKIDFTWALDNSDREASEFIADITPLENIALINYPEADLFVDGYGVVGTYSIIDNVFKITLNKTDGGSGQEFYESYERNGWAHIVGKIQVEDANAKDGDSIPYSVGTVTGNFEYQKDVSESTLGVSKSAQGSVEKVGGKYQQKFRVKVNASNGDVTGISLTDTMGTGLTNLSGVSIVETNVSTLAAGTSYGTDINGPFAGLTLKKDEYVTLEYTVEVNPSIYAPDTDWSLFKNKLTANYTSNLSQPGESTTNDVYASANRPSVSKSGTIPEGEQYVEWKITIRLNDLKDDDSFAALVTAIKDTPGAGLSGEGVPVDLAPGNFVETSTGSGEYTYTYKTPITDAYYNSISQLELRNNVTATIAGNDYTANGSVHTKGVTDIVSKSVVEDSFDEATGLLKWEVTIDTSKLPYDADTSDGDDNVKNFTLCDYASDVNGEITGNHTVNGASNVQIWVDGVQVVNHGQIINPSTGNAVVSGGNGIVESCTGYYTEDIRLSDAYLLSKVATDTPIKVIFQSYIKDTDRSGKLYQNTVYAKYTDPVTHTETKTPTAIARWEDTNVFKNSMEKVGAQVAGKNSLKYTVKINTANIEGLTAGKSILLEDVLPEDMTYDAGSLTISDYYKDTWNYYLVQDWLYNQAAASATTATATAVTEGGKDKLKIEIPVTTAFIKLGEYAKSSLAAEHFIQISYTTTIEDAQTFLENGVATAFKNEIAGTFNGDSIGGDSATTILTPQNVVNKVGRYDQITSPNIWYSVEVNPQALDLSDGALTAVDRLGSALSYNMDSIKVYENVNGTWVLLSGGYSYTRNLDNNSITFTLPDSKWLKLEYTARVLLGEGNLTAENAFNEFNLSGMTEGVGGESTQTITAVIEPAVGAEATTGSIKIWKYWGGSGSAHPLDGCTFAVYETDYNPVTKTYSKNSNIFKSGINVNANGEVTVYKLEKDKVYALVETAAKEGYKLNTTPYYFVIPSSDTAKAQFEGTNADIYTGVSPTLPFENVVDNEKGALKLAKSVSGVDFETAKAGIEFKVTGPNYEKVITGDMLTEYGNAITLVDLEPGNYTVTETKRDVTGYECKTTTYKVGSAAAVAGVTTSSFEVKKGETASVAFDNTYEQIKGSLKLTKTVTGTPVAPDFGLVQDTLKFVVTGPNGYSLEVPGSMLNAADHSYTIENLVPGEYKVVETVGLVTGYSRVETQNVLVVPGQADVTTNGITAENVTVLGNEITELKYTNAYEAGKGSIRLRKSVSGRTFEQIKGNISFEITCPDSSIITVQGSELVEPGNSLEIGGLEPGTYSITETATAVTGYTLYKTTYSVSVLDGGQTKDGAATGDFQVADGAIVEVAFNNAYEQEKGSLKLSKILQGAGLVYDDIDDSITFVVDGPGYHEEFSGTLLSGIGNSYVINGLVPGTYTIYEKNGEVTGYGLVKVENVVAGVTTESATSQVEVTSGAESEVTYRNTYEFGKGSIRLTKNTSGADFADIKDTLEYTITGPGYTREITGAELVDAGNSILITGLEPGDYTVTESRHDSNNEYTYKATVYSINGGTQQTGDATSALTLEAGKIIGVEFTNTYELVLGKLKISKNVAMSGAGSVTFADIKDTLTFRVTGPNNYNKVFAGDLFADDGTLTIENLVPGTYIVTEVTTDDDKLDLIRTEHATGGSAVAGKIATVIVTPSHSATEVTPLDFNNIYDRKKGTLVITKTIKGEVTKEEAEGALTFKVTDKLSGESKTYTLRDFAYDTATGKYVLTLPIAEGGYDVEETTYAIDGCAVTVKSSVGGAALTESAVVEATVQIGQTTNVDFENDYTRHKGKLVIQKTIKGEITKEEAEGALQFKVTNKDTGESKVYTLKDFTKNADGTYTLALDVNVGGYTVEETIYDVKGYITTSVTYSVNGGTAANGTKTDVAVGKDETVTVAFEDNYVKNVGKLVLTKTVQGDLIWNDVKDDITFVVTNKTTGESKTYKGSDFTDVLSNGVYTLTIEDLEPGEYTVTEKLKDVKGYLLVTSYTVDGGSKVVSNEATVKLTRDGVKVDFVNKYTSTRGKLVITKSLQGNIKRKDAEKAIKFKVTNVSTKKSKTYTLKDFTYDSDSEKYVLELVLEAGKYVVTETEYDVKGYELRSVSYTIDGGDKTFENSAKVKVKAGKTVQLKFVDRYIKKKTSNKKDTSDDDVVVAPGGTTPGASDATTGRETPKTGDESPIALWILMLLLGACGIGGSVWGLRRNSKTK